MDVIAQQLWLKLKLEANYFIDFYKVNNLNKSVNNYKNLYKILKKNNYVNDNLKIKRMFHIGTKRDQKNRFIKPNV